MSNHVCVFQGRLKVASNTNLVSMLFVSSMLFCKVVSDPILLSSTFNLKFTVPTLDGAMHCRVRVANLF